MEKCKYCNDSGMIIYFKETDGRKYEYACRCICNIGTKLEGLPPARVLVGKNGRTDEAIERR